MLTSNDFSGLLTERFFRNLFPIPATNDLTIGELAPGFSLPDITNSRTVKFSEYRNKQPVLLAFTRIFTENQFSTKSILAFGITLKEITVDTYMKF